MPQYFYVERPDDVDESGHLRPTVAEALLVACGQLAGRTQSSSVQLSLSWVPPAPSWPDGFGTLFAALQPVAIEQFALLHVSLEAAEVTALARCLPMLEKLDLACHVPVNAWPLLRRLTRLQVLRLRPGMGGSVDIWEEFGDEQALRAALLALCVDTPSLQRLELLPLTPPHDDEETSEAAQTARASCQAAMAWLRKALPLLRESPPQLVFSSEEEGQSS